mgnify:CR=1 FL=1
MNDEPVVIGVERAATLLDIPPDTMRRRCAAGAIPAVRIGGKWMIPTAYVERMLEPQS